MDVLSIRFVASQGRFKDIVMIEHYNVALPITMSLTMSLAF